MKIIGIAGNTPSRLVANQEVIDLVHHHSKDHFDGDLPKTLKIIGKLFEKSGTETRYWLAKDEQPMALMEAAFDRALRQAGINKKDVDLLIYSSVNRGFTEPANSAFIAKALGMTCMNYDIVNACMGWVSSMEIVNDKMKAGTTRYAVIVNMEFGNVEGGPLFPKNYVLNSLSELSYKFPSYTIGDAVTVTILGKDSPDNFKFSFINRPELSDLCTISLPGWQSFCNNIDIERIELTGGQYQFGSHGGEMHELGSIEIVKVFNEQKISKSDVQHVFTHTSSPKQWKHYGQLVGIADKIHSIGQKTGNVITASVPLAIVDAIEQGILKKNQFCLGWVGSAGMVFSAMTFTL